jgi:acyl-CoA synthetase (AMP-forming)/AMP-acid ligase II
MFSGCCNDDSETRVVFVGGWYPSDGLFRREPHGRLTSVARSPHMIRSGGENIHPAELERVFMQHPEVVGMVVVRRPDPNWGEVPVAVVAVKDTTATAEDMAGYCAAQLAAFKRPRDIQLQAINDFPRNVAAKVVRERLEAKVARDARAVS